MWPAVAAVVATHPAGGQAAWDQMPASVRNAATDVPVSANHPPPIVRKGPHPLPPRLFS